MFLSRTLNLVFYLLHSETSCTFSHCQLQLISQIFLIAIHWNIQSIEASTEIQNKRQSVRRLSKRLRQYFELRSCFTHCDVGYALVLKSTPFRVNNLMLPSLPCNTEKPRDGTPLVPVVNCNSRALIS